MKSPKYNPSPFGGGVGAIFGVLTPEKDLFDKLRYILHLPKKPFRSGRRTRI